MSNRTFRLSERRKSTYSFHNSLLSKVIISMRPLAGLGQESGVSHTQTDTHGPPHTPWAHTRGELTPHANAWEWW